MSDTTQAETILTQALLKYQPSTIISLYSGGYDSLCATHIAHKWWTDHLPEDKSQAIPFRVVSVDTLLSADGWADYVSNVSRAQGWPHIIWGNPNPNWYAQDCLAHGFPYTRSMHSLHYRMLKERAIREVKAHFKHDKHDRIMFITGIRRAESAARANTPEYELRGVEVWANPIVHWTGEQSARYRAEHDLPSNPFYDTVGGSGDCQCNWGNFITLDTLQKHSPQLGVKIADLNARVKAAHGWGWDERPSTGLLAERAGQLVLPGIEALDPTDTPNLCEGCSRVKPGHATAEEDWIINKMEW